MNILWIIMYKLALSNYKLFNYIWTSFFTVWCLRLCSFEHIFLREIITYWYKQNFHVWICEFKKKWKKMEVMVMILHFYTSAKSSYHFIRQITKQLIWKMMGDILVNKINYLTLVVWKSNSCIIVWGQWSICLTSYSIYFNVCLIILSH